MKRGDKKLIEEYTNYLKEYCQTGDIESNHREADDIICQLLLELGYGDIVEEYEKIDK